MRRGRLGWTAYSLVASMHAVKRPTAPWIRFASMSSSVAMQYACPSESPGRGAPSESNSRSRTPSIMAAPLPQRRAPPPIRPACWRAFLDFLLLLRLSPHDSIRLICTTGAMIGCKPCRNLARFFRESRALPRVSTRNHAIFPADFPNRAAGMPVPSCLSGMLRGSPTQFDLHPFRAPSPEGPHGRASPRPRQGAREFPNNPEVRRILRKFQARCAGLACSLPRAR